jgi:Fur family transcriptional regulator, ferric uptake regulator
MITSPTRNRHTDAVVTNGDLLHEDVSTLLRGGDHRYTSGRRRVVSVLGDSAGPMTILQILEIDSGLAQSSVYRNLAILEEVGAVTRIVTHDDHARYELAEGLTDHHHHHLICSTCGDVSDFALADELERTLERAFGRAAKRAGFALDDHRLDLVGRCAKCT